MDRSRARPPRLRSRLMIAWTITGLVLATLLPIVRSMPGLSRTPRRVEAPTVLAFGVLDASDLDEADSASPAVPTRTETEEDAGDPGGKVDEETVSAEWLADRPSRARAVERAPWYREAAPIARGPALAPAGRRPRTPFADVKPGLGLSVGLRRLLL